MTCFGEKIRRHTLFVPYYPISDKLIGSTIQSITQRAITSIHQNVTPTKNPTMVRKLNALLGLARAVRQAFCYR